MNALDVNTLQLMCAAIFIVLSVLMILLWAQDREQPANAYWCIFSVLLTIDVVINCSPELRNREGYVYLFNIISSFSYFALMIGCFKFVNIRINQKLLLLLFFSCLLLNLIGAFLILSDVERRFIIVSYNTIALVLSVYAILQLDKDHYFLEKIFMLILLSTHLSIHGFWFLINLDFSGAGETLLSRSITPVHVTLIFVTIALLLLSLGKSRIKLEKENAKSIAIKKTLTKAVKETNVANISKSIFLTNMSHELRTPLNIILGFSEALKLEIMGPLNSKQKNFVENIHFGGKRLLNLINDLLYLSNIEAGKLKENFEKIKPGTLLADLGETLNNISNQNNNTLIIIEDIPANDKSYLFIDNEWIRQVLVALVDNASKYGTKDGNIWLNIFLLDEKNIRITVRDQGKGIAHREQENVFKPFNRAGVDIKAIEGTGAGLAIVKGLVEAMSGFIDFESEQNSGTTFWIDLPLFRS